MIVSKIRDSIRLFFYKKLYDFNQKSNSTFQWKDIKTVVIWKLDGKLGDTQVLSPFLSSLQEKCPWITIIVISSSQMADIYIRCLHIRNCLVSPRRPDKNKLQQLASQIGTCDLFLTLEEKFRFHDFYILHILRPTFVAGINKNVNSINISLSNQGNHITDYFNFLLEKGGISRHCIQTKYTPLTTDQALSTIKPLCRKKQIAFSPWGASKHKHLTNETIIKTIEFLINKNFSVALLLPPEGAYLLSTIKSKVNPDFLVNVPDHITIYELSAFLKYSTALVSVDTANIHLASAFKIPIFGIYNGIDKKQRALWAPKTNIYQIFYKDTQYIDNLQFTDIKYSLSLFLEKINIYYS